MSKFAVALACTLAFVTGATTTAALTPIEHFAELPFLEAPKLSPDGNSIAAKINVDGEQSFVIYSLDPNKKDLRKVTADDSDINWWQWVNDDWLIVGTGATTIAYGEQIYITRMVRISADGKKMHLIGRPKGQYGDDLLWVSRDGSAKIVYAYQDSVFEELDFYPQVMTFDVATGVGRRIVRPVAGVMNWYADKNGQVRVGIGYSDDTGISKVYYRDSNKHQFKIRDRVDTKYGASPLVPFDFSDDGKSAKAFSTDDGYSSVYNIDLESFEKTEKLHEVKGYDLDGWFEDPATGAMAGYSYTDDKYRSIWLDPEFADMQAKIEQSVPGRSASITSISRDKSRMIIKTGGADRAGAFYLFDLDVATMYPIGAVNKSMGNKAMHPVKTVRIKARDGLVIPTVMTQPKGSEPKNLPVIIMPHGGPAARDSESWDWWAQFLADRGYLVLQPNFRGSTGFGTAHKNAGDGEWGLKMQDDLNDTLAWAAAEGLADPNRACMVGGSYGGYAALRAAQRDGKLYRCAVSFAGVGNLASLVRYDAWAFYGKSYKRNWRKLVPDFDSVSPLKHVEEFSSPVLLVHGKKDLRVPYEQSSRIYSALKSAGKSVEMVTQPLGDHHFTRQEDRLTFLQALEAFLIKHNPSDALKAVAAAPATAR